MESFTDSQGILYIKKDHYYQVGTGSGDNNAGQNLNVSEVFLPAKIGNFKVKVVSNYSFRTSSVIKSVFIPNTIIELCQDCFAIADNLEKVIFLDNSELKILRRGVFFRTNISEIIIPASVKEIGYLCFGCTKLDSLFVCGLNVVKLLKLLKLFITVPFKTFE